MDGFLHSPCGTQHMAGSRPTACRFVIRCTRTYCDFAHPSKALQCVPSIPSPTIFGVPKCPTAQHVMVISKGTYNNFKCNRCGASKSGDRWFCGNCKDDFCLDCEPRRDKPPSSPSAARPRSKYLTPTMMKTLLITLWIDSRHLLAAPCLLDHSAQTSGRTLRGMMKSILLGVSKASA